MDDFRAEMKRRGLYARKVRVMFRAERERERQRREARRRPEVAHGGEV
jgi:hypothetical protein